MLKMINERISLKKIMMNRNLHAHGETWMTHHTKVEVYDLVQNKQFLTCVTMNAII